MTSLRERKKAHTRAEIQRHALHLFAARGYEATTIEDIAAAANVARSTFFRYFASKEDVVLFDDVDPLFDEAFAAIPAGTPLLVAFVQAIRSTFDALDDEKRADEEVRMRLVRTVPKIAAVLRTRGAWDVERTALLVARATGRAAGALEVVVFSGALAGARLAAWTLVAREPDRGYIETTVEILDQLRGGVPLAEEPVIGSS